MIFVRFRHVTRLDTFLEQTDPIRRGEPFVIFDIFGSVLQIAEAFRQIGLNEIAN